MLVRDCMTRHPAMISPETRLPEAQRIMAENHIHHLPVVLDGKRLAGLITPECLALDPDLLGSLNVWEITRNLGDMRAKQVMIKARRVVTINAVRSVEEAASIMLEREIGCLPVVDEDSTVIGIVTKVDLLRSLQEILGVSRVGVRVTVRIEDKKGEFTRLMGTLAERGWCVLGIGGFPARRRPGDYDVVVKIADVGIDEVTEGFSQLDGQEIVDIRLTS